MNRETIFRLWFNNEIFGYERLTKNGWEWMCPKLNPDHGERWTPGVITNVPRLIRDQFTGRKDDHGTEVYEQDIVECLNGKRFKVEWNDDTCKYQLSDGQDINDGGTYGIYMVVVGNIYQTPDLIK